LFLFQRKILHIIENTVCSMTQCTRINASQQRLQHAAFYVKGFICTIENCIATICSTYSEKIFIQKQVVFFAMVNLKS
jgi:hypothetical protein